MLTEHIELPPHGSYKLRAFKSFSYPTQWLVQIRYPGSDCSSTLGYYDTQDIAESVVDELSLRMQVAHSLGA